MNPEDPATNPEPGGVEAVSAADDAVPVFRPSRAFRRQAPRTLESFPRAEGPPSEIGPVTLGDGPVSIPDVAVLDTSAFEGHSAGGTVGVDDDSRRWVMAVGLVVGALVGLGLIVLLQLAW